MNLRLFDLTTQAGYVKAIRAVGKAIIEVKSSDVGGSGKGAKEMGQFNYFNEKELARISRPGTGKLAYMIEFRHSKDARKFIRL